MEREYSVFFNFSFDLTTKYIGTKLIKTNAINFNGISCTVFSVISAPGVFNKFSNY